MSRHHHNLRGWSAARKKALNLAGYRCSECGKAGRLRSASHHRPGPRGRCSRTRQSHGNVSLLSYRDPQEQPGRTRPGPAGMGGLSEGVAVLKLDRLITLTRLNSELAPITVNDFGELAGGSPNTSVKVWARREITSGGEYFRSDGRRSGQNILLASFIIRHRTDIIPLSSGVIDSDRRMWADPLFYGTPRTRPQSLAAFGMSTQQRKLPRCDCTLRRPRRSARPGCPAQYIFFFSAPRKRRSAPLRRW